MQFQAVTLAIAAVLVAPSMAIPYNGTAIDARGLYWGKADEKTSCEPKQINHYTCAHDGKTMVSWFHAQLRSSWHRRPARTLSQFPLVQVALIVA